MSTSVKAGALYFIVNMLDIVKDNNRIVSLIKEYQSNNNIEIRNKLIVDCYKSLMRYAGYFCRQYRFFEVFEYENIIIDTFIEVIGRYKADKNAKFTTYFHIRARGNILDNMRKVRGRYKNKVKIISLDKEYKSKDGYYTLQDFLVDSRIDIEKDIVYKDELDRIKQKYLAVYNKLRSKKSKQIFIDYYFNGLKPYEIGIKLGLTNNYVRVVISNINRKYFPERVRKYNKKS